MQRLRMVAVLLLLMAATVWADGKMFIRGEAKVRIPDQSALICFDGKTERLVIETAFEGKSDEYAWVVPLPAEPKIEAATPGLFPTLRCLTRPRVVGYVASHSIFLLITAIGVALLWIGFYVCRGWDVFAFSGIVLLFIMLVPPAMGTAGGTSIKAVHDDAVVLQHRRVGVYDTVVLSGQAGRTVQAWLSENGFRTPATAIPVLDDYAQRGWVFAAARLNKDGDADAVSRTHPLSFTFPTEEAVYPLKLTAVDNGPLALDLYVLGPSSAQADGLQRVRGAEWVPDPDEDERRSDARIPVAHPSLVEYSSHGDTKLNTVTRLSGTLPPERMANDLTLTWRPLKAFRPVYYMRASALHVAAEWALIVCAAGFCVSSLSRQVRRRRKSEGPRAESELGQLAGVSVVIVTSVLSFVAASTRDRQAILWLLALLGCFLGGMLLWPLGRLLQRRSERTAQGDAHWRAWRAYALWLLISLAVFVGVYLALPVLPSSNAHSWVWQPNLIQRLGDDVGYRAKDLPPPETLDDCRAQVQAAFDGRRHAGLLNFHTGQPLCEEDSPGNYTVEQDGDGFVYCIYSETGRRSVVFRWPVKDAGAPPQAPSRTSGISEER